MKTCSKCNIEKSKNLFYKDARNKDGLKYACKKCSALKTLLSVCHHCNKEFMGAERKKFCSKECQSIWRLGQKKFIYGAYVLPDSI